MKRAIKYEEVTWKMRKRIVIECMQEIKRRKRRNKEDNGKKMGKK